MSWGEEDGSSGGEPGRESPHVLESCLANLIRSALPLPAQGSGEGVSC